jgi:hypothetical protein
MNLTNQIEQLRILVWEEVNEKRILEIGEPIVLDLRSTWKMQRHDFSSDNVETLRDLVKKVEAIKAFIEVEESFQYISTKEDVDEVTGDLFLIGEELNELNVSGRVNKEIRGLLEKKLRLPAQKSVNKTKALHAIYLRAPTCDRCGNKMLLREGNGFFFYGCTTFPKCYGKKYLTDEEQDKLSN